MDGTANVVNTIYKNDSSTVLFNAYRDFNSLVSCIRNQNGSFYKH